MNMGYEKYRREFYREHSRQATRDGIKAGLWIALGCPAAFIALCSLLVFAHWLVHA